MDDKVNSGFVGNLSSSSLGPAVCPRAPASLLDARGQAAGHLDLRLRFPEVGKNSDRISQSMDDYLKTSLLHEDDLQLQPKASRAPQQALLCRLCWGVWQQPIGKMGTIILFMSWLLVAVATTASLLSWIGTLGMVTGATLLGLSLFAACFKNARNNTSQTEEELSNGRISPP